MNPEFQRNLWLESSPRRIAWAVVVLVLIYGATAMGLQANPFGALSGLSGVGAVVFVACAMIWGARAAGRSILTEIADRTWDFQRLSALDAWSMTWGKLAGAASLAWICGLTGLLLVAADGLQKGDPMVLTTLIFMIGLAVLLQGVSMGAALIGVRKARAEGRVARAGGVLGGLIVGAILLSWVSGSVGFQRGAPLQGVGGLLGGPGIVNWGGQYWPGPVFRAVSVSLFAAWAVAAAWRLMRLELQMRTAPLVWPGFLVFLAIYAGGFAVGQGGAPAAFTAAAMVMALCVYAAAFAEPADRVRLRQFARLLSEGDLKRAANVLPTPVLPLVLAALLVIAAISSGGFAPGPAQGAALVAFVLRDLGVIALCRLSGQPQRGDFHAVVALALLYGVGGIIGWSVARHIGTALFAPSDNLPLISLASGLIQAGVAWVLVSRRLRPPSEPASAPAS